VLARERLVDALDVNPAALQRLNVPAISTNVRLAASEPE